ncbi:MAG TPA: sugar transferase [Acidobacteriaceae bacterium]|nr:sugar transferase [Acidobacteriaceae bacterium]
MSKPATLSHTRAVSKDVLWNGSVANRIDNFHEYFAESRSFRFSAWCASPWKRVFDLLCVTPALILLSPLLLAVAIAVRLTSRGPVVFRQRRAGQNRKLFTIYKFRTMVQNSESIGPRHTAKGDPRITAIGCLLRRFKLDELPQLYNVLRGDMSLVGPRPKLPEHEHTQMICRPGVTGAATLAFREEQHILCEVPTERLEAFYREHLVPLKIKLDAEYMQKATFLSDLSVLFSTLFRDKSFHNLQELMLVSSRQVQSASSHLRLVAEPTGD